MGVSGCGKTSVGAVLAGLLDLDFVDGDDLHPASNVDKMHAGHPLTDQDRWPWLDRIGATLADAAAHPRGCVVACSALKRAYRDRIRAEAGPGLVFVFLDITPQEAHRRLAVRLNHFMPAALLDSQFATLERPDGESDVVTITRLETPTGTARDAAAEIERRAGG
jgi:gluconokinase